jgi:hypothetical protein
MAAENRNNGPKKGIPWQATADKHVSDYFTTVLELYVCPSIKMYLAALLIMKGFE